MDVLEYYDSDSSTYIPSSVLHANPNPNDNTSTEKEDKVSTHNILSNYSEQETKDHSSYIASKKKPVVKMVVNNKEVHSKSLSVSVSEDSVNDLPKEDRSQSRPSVHKRRRRLWDHIPGTNTDMDNQKHETHITIPIKILPKPKLASDVDPTNTFDLLTRFDKDYLSPRQASFLARTAGCPMPNATVAIKLDKMYHEFYGENDNDSSTCCHSFASHLKRQKEFSNPNMFPSIIEHFQIKEWGSNIPSTLWNAYTDFSSFEFIEKMKDKEEEARMRHIQTEQQWEERKLAH